jgi:hypothetical protein
MTPSAKLWSEDLGLEMEEALALFYMLRDMSVGNDKFILDKEIKILEERIASINIHNMLTED